MRFLKQLFFAFYYRYCRLLTTLMPNVTFDGKRIAVPPTVYKPLENEHRFREYIRKGNRVCDLGCGCGVVSVFCAEVAESVVALDIGEEAVRATQHNCEQHGLTNVEVYKSDMYAAAQGSFDCICANPPFVEIPMKGEDFQWATSTCFLNRLFSEGRDYLKTDGKIIVLYPKSKQARLVEFAEPAGFQLTATQPIGPKSFKIWLTCLLYMELFFNAHFFVFEKNR